MKTRNIFAGLAVLSGLLTAQTESSAQLNKLIQKAKDNAHRIENAVNNQQGTETIRVSMYGNRYPYLKAFDLFGVIDGYGAQMPQ